MASTKPAHAAPETRNKNLLRAIIVAIGIAIIPLIYASLLTSSFSDPQGNLDNIPAAVVNLDQEASHEDTTLDLGEDLTAELLDSTERNNFTWQEYGAEEAQQALASGEVYAVLTIPADFSANAISPAGDDPKVAQLSIETNDGANMFAGTIANQLGTVLADTLAGKVSEEYLANIYAGFTTLHGELSTAADGASRLEDGTVQAGDGAQQLNVGLNQLVSGTGELASAVGRLEDGSGALATGAGSLVDGARTLDTGITTLRDGTSQAATGASELADGTQQLADAVNGISDKAAPIVDAIEHIRDHSSDLTTGSDGMVTSLDELLANWDALSDEEKQAMVEQLATDAGDLRDGVGSALEGAENADLGGLEGLKTLPDKVNQLNDGAQQLADANTQIDSGVGELADGSGQLVTGASDLADGASSLHDGTVQLREGVASLRDGTVQAHDGSGDLVDGIDELKDGSGTLAEGLDEGVESVPSYTDAESDRLSEVAASPVQFEHERMNEVPRNAEGMAPYFMSLALWVGGMAFYMMNNPLGRASGRMLSGLDALRSYLPGAIMGVAQSALLFVTMTRIVGIEVAHPVQLMLMVLLVSLTFVAINQALIALLGAPGRFAALVLIVLQLSSAGATYPVETAPGLFQALHPWLPLSHAVDAFRSLIAGGGIGVDGAVWFLLAWFVGALIVTSTAVFIKRIPELPVRIRAWNAKRAAHAKHRREQRAPEVTGAR